MIFELKSWVGYFEPLARGDKPFDVRRYHDRPFRAGDRVIFLEWNPDGNVYTGRSCVRMISYVLAGRDAEIFGVKPGYCVLGLMTANPI